MSLIQREVEVTSWFPGQSHQGKMGSQEPRPKYYTPYEVLLPVPTSLRQQDDLASTVLSPGRAWWIVATLLTIHTLSPDESRACDVQTVAMRPVVAGDSIRARACTCVRACVCVCVSHCVFLSLSVCVCLCVVRERALHTHTLNTSYIHLVPFHSTHPSFINNHSRLLPLHTHADPPSSGLTLLI